MPPSRMLRTTRPFDSRSPTPPRRRRPCSSAGSTARACGRRSRPRSRPRPRSRRSARSSPSRRVVALCRHGQAGPGLAGLEGDARRRRGVVRRRRPPPTSVTTIGITSRSSTSRRRRALRCSRSESAHRASCWWPGNAAFADAGYSSSPEPTPPRPPHPPQLENCLPGLGRTESVRTVLRTSEREWDSATASRTR